MQHTLTNKLCKLFMLWSLLISSLVVYSQNNSGKEFYAAQTPNFRSAANPSYDTARFAVVVSNPQSATANVEIFNSLRGNLSFSLAPGEIQTHFFSSENINIQSSGTYTNNVYRITSNIDIVAYSFTPYYNIVSNDAALLLPVNGLGRKYMATSYANPLGNTRNSLLSFVATSPGTTTVQIYNRSNSTTPVQTVILQQGQYYQRMNGNTMDADVTGWYIEADKNIACFTGSQQASVGNSNLAADHLIEQIPPIETLASTFIASPTNSRPIGCTTCVPDVFRYIPTESGNTIKSSVALNGKLYTASTNASNPPADIVINSSGTFQGGVLINLTRGQFVEVATNQPHIVTSGRPFYAFQYLISEQASDGNYKTLTSTISATGDPSLWSLPVVDQYQFDYTFIVPNSFPYNFVNITAPTGSTIQLDSNVIAPTWRSVGTAANGITYSTAAYPVTPGKHKIVSQNKMGIVVTGFGPTASYAYMGGSGLEPINAGCITGGPYQVLTCNPGTNHIQLNGIPSCENPAYTPTFRWSSTSGVVFSDVNASNPIATVVGYGTFNITLSVTCNNNTIICTSEIIVRENLNGCAITIQPPANIVVNNDAGVGYATNVNPGTATYSSDAPATLRNNAPSQFPLGVTTVVWTVTDIYGRSKSASHTVTVVSAPPAIVAPATINVIADYNGFATIPDLGTPTTTVSINPAAVTNSGTLSQYPIGTTNVTWTVKDGIDRTASDVQNIIVTAPAPRIDPPADITIGNDPGQQYSTQVTLVNPVYQAIGPVTLTNDAPAQFPLGTTTVTWTLTDAYGNIITTSNKVTVTSAAPTITAPPAITVTAGYNGFATVNDLKVNGNEAVNVSVNPATVTNNSSSTQYAIGTANITWTVTDGINRTASDVQQVIVLAPLPKLNPVPDVTVPNNPGLNYATVTLVPPTYDAIGPVTLTNDAPAQFPIGETIVTWTLTDKYGKTTTTTQKVTVTSAAPTITAPPAITVTAGYNGFATVNDLKVNGNETVTLSVNPSTVTNNNSSTQYAIGTTNIAWTVTDGINRTASDVQQVIVLAPLPKLNPVADVIVSNNTGVSYATVTLVPPTYDAIGPVTLISNAPAQFPLGETIVTWTLTDKYGNTTTVTQKVTVLSAPPTIVAPASITVTAAAGQSSAAIANIGNAAYTVSVNPANLSSNAPVNGVFPIGTTTVIWTVQDGLGRTATATQTITVNAPVACSFLTSVVSIPTDNTPTGGNPNNLYIGYGAQSTKLQVNVPNTGGPYTFQWSGDGLNSYTSAAPVFTPGNKPGTYNCTVNVKNSNGCTSTATISICVRDVRSLDKNGNWDGKKVIVCHLPPGNPANVQYIDVSINAVPAHVPLHGGDGLGNTCVQKSCTSPYARGAAPVTEVFGVSVYPNPSAGVFALTVKSDDKYTDINIRIIDAFGRTVEVMNNVTAGRTVVFGDRYANGAYYAEVVQGSDKKILPLVKTK